jgi:drug/metabolite transporter (DMT)-like permease
LGLGLAVTAALVTGVAQVSMTTLSRRMGTTITSSLVLTASLLWILPTVIGHSIPGSAAWWTTVLALGVANGAAFLLAVEAFRLGPLTRVGPIAATSSIVTVIMASVLLGETLPPVAWVAAPIAAVGAILCVVAPPIAHQVQSWVPERGPLLMICSVVLIGLFTVGFRDPTRESGWAPAVLVGRLATVGTVVAVLGFQAIRTRRARSTNESVGGYVRPGIAAAAIGLLISIAQVLILASLEVGPAWVTGAAMAVSTGTVVVAGMLLFQERPTRQQWTGIGGIAVAVSLLTIQLALTSYGQASAT